MPIIDNNYTIYLELEGIKGDSTAESNPDQMQVYSLDWSVNRVMNTAPGRTNNREAGEMRISEFTLTKNIDSASPRLFLEACTGKKGLNGKIMFKKNNESDSTMEYFLTNVLISHYSTKTMERPGSGQSVLVETFRLNFTKVEIVFTGSESPNNKKAPIRSNYDLTKATGG